MPGRSNGGEDRKTLQYFSESDDEENEIRKHIREKLIRETELFFLHLVFMKPRQGLGRGNSPNSICRFVLFLHLVVKPLGMNVIILPLIFIQKSRPSVLHTNQKQRQSHSGDYHNRNPIHSPHIRSQ